MTHTVQRTQRDGRNTSVQCPDAIVLYNWYMAGVDKGDRYQQYYHVRTKSRKNYRYTSFGSYLMLLITNTFILSSFVPTTMPKNHQQLKAFHLKFTVLL